MGDFPFKYLFLSRALSRLERVDVRVWRVSLSLNSGETLPTSSLNATSSGGDNESSLYSGFVEVRDHYQMGHKSLGTKLPGSTSDKSSGSRNHSTTRIQQIGGKAYQFLKLVV